MILLYSFRKKCFIFFREANKKNLIIYPCKFKLNKFYYIVSSIQKNNFE